ncbi:hypothetical protein [Amycolatopsis azurea]|uniref:Uncharacterized protein n=1 Tax=Amycolatopsis azurea DSM 43854 TaxID=1238180 RepID=M2NMC0_9PSEU|nr:hypothetical protein [Amycolatopsis azurea]EMD23304.1 hypothetical protein C791_7394 [Amycolatopsis azurea DSM 43854]OOC03545.1 hypothetical protein B0293_27015 [Amycolatopsis azurea DSM 43854]
MPRRAPARVRQGLRLRHPPDHRDQQEFTPALAAELSRLERARGYLGAGAIWTALRLYREFIADPYRRLRVDSEGCGIWECCGDPRDAREMLEGVLLALPARLTPEFRRYLQRIDDRW